MTTLGECKPEVKSSEEQTAVPTSFWPFRAGQLGIAALEVGNYRSGSFVVRSGLRFQSGGETAAITVGDPI